MPDHIPPDSVGLVTPGVFESKTPLVLESGETLPEFQLIFETYGELNSARNNAVLVCHALSGHHHAAGYHAREDRKPGWWDLYIGPGKPIDTNHFFVVSLNNLGGCNGSTGPISMNPRTDRIWGPDFPQVTVKDWVKSQALLMDWLDIQQWAVVIGGSLGGMQALQWSVDYPQLLRHAVLIASAAKLSAQNIAFNEIARHAILSDPDFLQGRYKEAGRVPEMGLQLARMVGHMTYQSDDGMRDKFGRALHDGDWQIGFDVKFQVENYLQYQGSSFSKYFDANTYLLMTRALDYFDLARECGGDLVAILRRAKCRFLLISFTTDWRFPVIRSREIATALVRAGQHVSNIVIDAPNGHDAFLLEVPRYQEVLKTYLMRVAEESENAAH